MQVRTSSQLFGVVHSPVC